LFLFLSLQTFFFNFSIVFINHKSAFQSMADLPRTGYTDKRFCSFDLDLDPMTFIYKPDLDIPKMHMLTKMNFLA